MSIEKKNINKLVIYIIMLITVVVYVCKCFYSVDITDESYIYADALTMLKGNLPYVHNFSSSAGMSFVTIPFLWLYSKIIPSLSGVVLYLRLCAILLKFMNIYIVYWLLEKKHDGANLLSGILMMLAWYYAGNGNCFGYNSSSIYLMLLASALLYVYYDEDGLKARVVGIGGAGFLSALACFVHPLYVIAVFMSMLNLWIFSCRKEKIKNCCMYFVGGMCQVVIITASLIFQTGFGIFVYGIKETFFRAGQNTSMHKLSKIVKYFSEYKYLFLVMALAYVITYFILNKLRAYIKNTPIIVSFISGIIYIVFLLGMGERDKFIIDAYFGTVVVFVSIFLLVRYKDRLLLFCGIPFVLFSFFNVFFSRTAHVDAHTAFAIPAYLAMMVCLNMHCDDMQLDILNLINVVLCTAMLVAGSNYVYRDAPLSKLNTKITEGIYKGIYSTEERAKCLPEMENYIRNVTSEDDYVSFRDCVPFAYLMLEGQCCDIQTWDSMQYTNSGNEPWMMYNYYKNKGHIPDKIIYIDFERDEKLSIDDKEFLFNSWVNTYYNLYEDKPINDMFSVKAYAYNGAFNGDFSWWTAD